MPRNLAEEFAAMEGTFRPGIGLKRRSRETWHEAALRHLRNDKGPLVPRFIYQNVDPSVGAILDFGCGAAALHVYALRACGYDVWGYDLPSSPDDPSARADAYWEAVEAKLLDPEATEYEYACVFASNVLNVQPSWPAFERTLGEIVRCMDPDGVFVANLASEPRTIWSSGREGDGELDTELRSVFDLVVWHKDTGIWQCRL